MCICFPTTIPDITVIVGECSQKGFDLNSDYPKWPGREWYPILLDLLIGIPLWLVVLPDPLLQDNGSPCHHNSAEMALVTCRISGQDPTPTWD